MKIVIDMQGLQTKASGGRGVGRYTKSLVRALIQQNLKHEIILALNGVFLDSIDKIRDEFCDILPLRNIVVWQNYVDSSAYFGSKEIQEIAALIRECFFWSLDADIIFSTNLQEGFLEPAVNSVKKIYLGAYYLSTLHDLVPYYYSKQYLSEELAKNWYYEKIQCVVDSDIIIADSSSTEKDILKFLNVSKDKIHVIDLGYDKNIFNSLTCSHTELEIIKKKYNIDGDFIMYTGGGDPHKNIERLIESYASDSSIYSSVKLVLVGRDFLQHSQIQILIDRLSMNDNILLPGFIDDCDVVSLLKSSKGFVFPSTHEGFGLPVIEAMACGVPTIGSNQSSIAEVIANEEALFNPYDIHDIAQKIKQLISDGEFAQRVINVGIKRAANYSWDKSANELLEIINNLPYLSKHPFDMTILLDAISHYAKDISNQELLDVSQSIANTFLLCDKGKIYLDISSVIVQDHKTGIQRVTRAISSALKKKYPNTVYLIYFNSEFNEFYVANQYTYTNIIDTDMNVDEKVYFYKGDILLYLDLHPGLAIAQKDNNIALMRRGVYVYHILYDIIPIKHGNYFADDVRNQFESWLEVVSYSSGAMCISNSVAKELKEYYKQHSLLRKSFLIRYFHLGADIDNSISSCGGIDDSAKNILSIIEDNISFLMVGTLEPRKGHRQVIEAFNELCKQNSKLCLVLVGKIGWLSERFESYILNHALYKKNIFWLRGVSDGISDEYLEQLYLKCDCLIAASEAEGFGLPLIEAAQHKLPIIARDIPVFREVAGNQAYYFHDSKESIVIENAILEWLSLYDTNQHPRSENMPYLTWEQSADQLFEIITN